MNTVMQFLETTFSPLILIFTVANLFVMGLQAKMPEVIVALKNKKSMALIFVWGWVLGPALGLPDRLGSSSGRTLCNRYAPLQSGAVRAVPPTDGGKSSKETLASRAPLFHWRRLAQ